MDDLKTTCCGHYREEIVFKKEIKYLQNCMYQVTIYQNNLTWKYFVMLQEDTKRMWKEEKLEERDLRLKNHEIVWKEDTNLAGKAKTVRAL